MPFSSESGKASIRWVMSKIPAPKMALDIGCGQGTYAKMFPNLEWTGVEIWEPYVEKYNLSSLYKNLFVRDVKGWDSDDHFDVCFLGDILEHMTAEEAQHLLRKCKRLADTVIVSIPIGHYPQGAFEGNPHEKHVTDDWTDEKFKETFGVPTWSIVDGEIGVYVYSKHEIRLTYCVYAISKNEEQFVRRFCKSAEDADLVLIADTGSTDKTVDVARECGAAVYDVCISPWRFDHARNAALALVPRDIDICVSLDLDEVLEPGWREEVERLWVPGKTTNMWYMFDWSQGVQFPARKIHARHGYSWKHPCHEDLQLDPRLEDSRVWSNKFLITHHPDPTKSRGQYMPLLELAVKEDDRDPHHYFYYARELTFYKRWDEAKVALQKYLDMNAPSAQNERSYAMRLLGKSYSQTNDRAQAEKWYYLAAAEAPNTREPWCELALLMHHQHRWEECFAASMRALRIKERSMVYTCDPAVWGYWAHDLASIAAHHLGLKDIALEQAQLAVDLAPDDLRLRRNLRYLTDTYKCSEGDASWKSETKPLSK